MLQERRLTATTIITTTTTTTTTNVLKHNDEPFTIFTLYSSSGREMASLAMMLDDVSISGFANRTGHWHAFQGHEHHLPGSTPLPFGNSYRDLIGGLPNLPNLPLGWHAMLHATSAISGYGPATGDDVAAVKRAGDADGDDE
ncbi:hypothetical protein HU200_065302 [Digitaria exilis]|uniref:rRNA N-glycosylase n=1 Tax=Digitaria exilis TaxID=1010633 RepID=A0A835DV43_9POAL|nr:hypothetical protein HU200_065302 [Digitaria exilis]